MPECHAWQAWHAQTGGRSFSVVRVPCAEMVVVAGREGGVAGGEGWEGDIVQAGGQV